MREADAMVNIRPQDVQVPKEALTLIARSYAERYRVCPVSLAESRNGARTLTIATVDPSNILLLDQLQKLTNCRIVPVMATEQDIMRGIDVHYNPNYTDAPVDLLQQIGNVETSVAPTPQTANLTAEVRGASGTVESILQRAIAERASDIHIEPHSRSVYVRFRIDGVMYDHMTFDPSSHAQVISRIKILSKLDIAQQRLPHDGRFDVSFGNREFDVRVSIVPATGGEKAVLRMLPKGQVATDLGSLGLDGHNREILEELTNRPSAWCWLPGRPDQAKPPPCMPVCPAWIASGKT